MYHQDLGAYGEDYDAIRLHDDFSGGFGLESNVDFQAPFTDLLATDSLDTNTPSLSSERDSSSNSRSKNSSNKLRLSIHANAESEDANEVSIEIEPTFGNGMPSLGLRPTMYTNALAVDVYHKPRGSQGQWMPVDADQALRVSPTGKNLRLFVKTALPARPTDFGISLVSVEKEGHTSQLEPNALQVSKCTHTPIIEGTFANMYEFDVKLYVSGRVLLFAVQLGNELATSVHFRTHNTGKVRKGDKSEGEKERTGRKRSLPDQLSDSAPPARRRKGNDEDEYPSPSSYDSTGTRSALSPSDHSSPMAPAQMSTPVPSPSAPSGHSDGQLQHAESTSGLMEGEHHENERAVIYSDLDVLGVVRAHHFTQYSDIRLKTNIENLVDALGIVAQLQGKRYEWREGTAMRDAVGGRKVIGLIAQELKRVIPEVVYEDERGTLSVNYSELVPVLISAINEQSAKLGQFQKDTAAALLRLQEVTDALSHKSEKTRSSSDPVLEEQVARLASTLRFLTDKVEKDKEKQATLNSMATRPKRNRLVPYHWRRWLLGAGALILVLSVACVALFFALDHERENDKNSPIVKAEFTDNIVDNYSFEHLAAVGDLASRWLPAQDGYSILVNDNSTWRLVGSADTDIRNVSLHDGHQCLRLGSTSAVRGSLRTYVAFQRTVLPDPSPKYVHLSGWCNAAEAGTETSTRFYISVTPVLLDNSLAPWQVRLFYTYGYNDWEEASKTIELTAEETKDMVGFEVKVELITTALALFYCDAISIDVAY